MKREQIIKLLKLGIIVFAIVLAFEILFSINAIAIPIQNFFEKIEVGGYIVIFILQFLQVWIIPVPAYFITLASLNLFPNDLISIWFFKINFVLLAVTMAAYVVGVVVAYIIGRKWGKRAVRWAAGNDEDYDKWCKALNTKKSKLFYFLTVLFPIFPDNILCYIAGSIKMNFAYYMFCNFVGRLIGLVAFMITFANGGGYFEIIIFSIILLALIIAYIVLKIKEKKNPTDSKDKSSLVDEILKLKEEKDMKISSKELRNKWLNFYKEREHVDIGAVSLIGDGATGVMFNVAGMQPLMPYLLGKKHPRGTRLCNVQGCVRTVDIESVGDASHFTFFEMMGNWSLGDYFKQEKTKWSFEFLTKELGFDKDKICSTVFAGNENVPKDTEIVDYLVAAGVKKENIYYLKENWWDLPGTSNTPCGPDNEWFYPRHDKPCCDNCDINCECGRWVEIGNDVYMQYMVKEDRSVEPLKNKNVDTGFGFERLLMYVNGLSDGYKTDLFTDVISYLENASGRDYGKEDENTKAMRIIADHIRTSTMLIGDEKKLTPSNVGAGYILRRLLRRAIRYAKQLNLTTENLLQVSKIFIEKVYNEAYPNLLEKEEFILNEIAKETEKFNKTLEQGLKEFEKLINRIEKHKEFALKSGEVVENLIKGKDCFRLYDTFGFPLELTKEMAEEKGYKVDEQGFDEAFKEHQEKSKAVNAGDFKSGLQDNSEMTIKYHTATHLLNAALKLVIGENTHQKGSNITAERLRFDFNCDHKLTSDEIEQVEKIVNEWINDKIEVTREEMNKFKAVELGAEHEFIEKYPDIVSVYSVGNISKEICTGPHVKNTEELGQFKVVKEEASSSGVRRIKAILK